MQPNNQPRYYSPPFSAMACISVRRLAWAMGLSMPAVINIMVRFLPSLVNSVKVCQACKDKTKCQACIFNNQPAQQQNALSPFTEKEQTALQAVV